MKTDEEVIKFLSVCGEENLQFLLQPARLEGPRGPRRLVACDAIPLFSVDATSSDQTVIRTNHDVPARTRGARSSAASQKRLAQLAADKSGGERAAAKADVLSSAPSSSRWRASAST